MARLGIDDLRLPPTQFRPDKVGHTAGGSRFETEAAARAEDRLRAKLIASAGDSELFATEQAADLAYRLNYDERDVEIPDTLASALRFRDHRIRAVGNLWRAIEAHPAHPLAFFTAIPNGWTVPAADLFAFDPVRRLASFKSDLYRSGATRADGYLWVSIHGEFDPVGELYQMHLHGLAAGGLVEVLDRLRKRPKYRSYRRRGDRVSQRIKISRQPLSESPADRVRRLTYLLQSWWPSKAIWAGAGGRMRSRKRQRIPEPFHTQYLLWLDRNRLSDMTLLVGMSVQRDELVVRESCTPMREC